MVDSPLLRLLEVVRRELEASDVRAEVGGKDPVDPRVLWTHLPGGWRLVVVFEQPPEDRTLQTERLEALAESFFQSASHTLDEPHPSAVVSRRRLNDELARVAARAAAVRALVLDAQSPVLWGTSALDAPEQDVESAIVTARAMRKAESAGVSLETLTEASAGQLEDALRAAGLEQEIQVLLVREAQRVREHARDESVWKAHLLTTRAIAALRALDERADSALVRELVRHDGFGYLSRSFAKIYRLLLVFDHSFSELHAEAALLHALPLIEQLVLALPPIDPPPRRGQVVRLPSRS